jgi:hypothetical protein
MANQYVDQLTQGGDKFLLSAIFNNCGTTITFRVGATDAKFFEQIYYDPDTNKGFKATDLANMDKYTVITKVMTQSGVQSQPFTVATLPPVTASPHANPELVKKRSRSRICIPFDIVRKSIEDRMKMDTLADMQN